MGDPRLSAHATVKDLIEDYPTFGICLGHQIITPPGRQDF